MCVFLANMEASMKKETEIKQKLLFKVNVKWKIEKSFFFLNFAAVRNFQNLIVLRQCASDLDSPLPFQHTILVICKTLEVNWEGSFWFSFIMKQYDRSRCYDMYGNIWLLSKLESEMSLLNKGF